jgi:hypothetical protein
MGKKLYKIKAYNNDVDIIVDSGDYNYLSKYNWSVHGGYAQSKIDGRTVYMARFIMDCPKGLTVDHKNHNTLDNRRSNLRVCSYSENNYNKRCGNKNKFSKYKGVRRSFLPNKWKSEISFNGISIYIGDFYTEDYAAIKYNEQASLLQKEFAYLNEVPYDLDTIIKNERIAEKEYFKKNGKYSKYRYVSFNKGRGKWFGQKWINKKILKTSFYDTELEAYQAVLELIALHN